MYRFLLYTLVKIIIVHQIISLTSSQYSFLALLSVQNMMRPSEFKWHVVPYLSLKVYMLLKLRCFSCVYVSSCFCRHS